MFQKSVLKNVSQDESIVALRWAEYQKYLTKLDFIKEVKEEKQQDGFLKDIFENCLGYTLDSTNPNDFNLEREKKNETDGKKADGVIYVNGEVIGIIELKAQDTKNLDKIEKVFTNIVDEILISKQKIKDYTILLDEAIKSDNFDREIKLKTEIETFEKIVSDSEKEIDVMVYKLYRLNDDEIEIVEGL